MKDLFYKYNCQIIVLIWVLSTIFYLKQFGLFTHLEAEKYIYQAQHLIEHGNFTSIRFLFYSITTIIIAFSLLIKSGMIGAFVIQASLNLFSMLIFRKALNKIFLHQTTSFFVIVLLLLFWPYQSWICFLYTESVFYSAILILTSAIILYTPNNSKQLMYLFGSLLLVIFSRPLGILFAAGVIVFLFYSSSQKTKKILLISSGVFLAVFIYAVNTIFSNISDWYITKPFVEESIICDLPNSSPSGTTLNLTHNKNPLFELFYYIKHNFKHFIRFAFLKLEYFFGMTRSYYSRAHNQMLIGFSVLTYSLSLISFFIRKTKLVTGVVLFIVTTILFYTLAIIFQCDDYHNRFILSIFPFFVILAGITIDYCTTAIISLRRTSSPTK